MIEIELKVQGLRELNDALKALPRDVSEKLLDRAVGAGAAVVREEVARRAPIAASAHFRARGMKVPPGVLRKAVVAARAKDVATFFSRTWIVGVRHGKRFRKGGQDAFYWWWVENGHKIVSRNGGSARRTIRARRVAASGRVTANPFLRPAFELKKVAAVEAMRAFLEDQIPRAAARVSRRGF